MKRLLLTIIFATAVLSAQGNGYTYEQSLTLDHTKAGSVDSTAWPYLFAGTFAGGSSTTPDLRVTGSGGQVTNSSGFDIGFFTDSTCATKVTGWEVESYTSTSGAIAAWVYIATLSHTTDTVIYMCWGNASISTFQSTASNVWDSSYKLVLHMNTTATADSTTNALTVTATGTSNQTGQIAGAVGYAAGTDKTTITYNAVLAACLSGACTVQFWYRTGTLTSYEAIVDTVGRNFAMFINGGATNACFCGLGNGLLGNIITGLDTTATWQQFYMRRSGTGSNQGDFILNNSKTTVTLSGTTNGSANITLGSNSSGGGSSYQGRIDEFRISTTARSDSWVTAEYNNQNSPSTFYTPGTVNTASGSTLGPRGAQVAF